MWTPKFLAFVTVAAILIALPARLLAAEDDDAHKKFLKQVAREAAIARQARALYRKSAPKPLPSDVDVMLTELRIKKEADRRRALMDVRRTRSVPALEVPVDRVALARTFVKSEKERKADRADERVRILLDKAKAHIEGHRYVAAIHALDQVLVDQPRHRVALRLREMARRADIKKSRKANALQMERHTAATMRQLGQSRVPAAETLTVPPGWKEKTRQVREKQAREFLGEPVEEDTKVKRALAKTMSIDAIDMPLGDVAAYFRHVTGVNFVLDKGLEDKRLTLKLERVTVGSALAWVAKQTGAAFSVRRGVVHIAPPSKIREDMALKIYNVSDLLHEKRLLTKGKNMHRAFNAGRKAVIADDGVGGIAPFEQIDSKSTAELAEDLMGFIRVATGRENWDGSGGAATMNYKLRRLVVYAPAALHLKVLRALNNAR
jgi:hypothetical protein